MAGIDPWLSDRRPLVGGAVPVFGCRGWCLLVMLSCDCLATIGGWLMARSEGGACGGGCGTVGAGSGRGAFDGGGTALGRTTVGAWLDAISMPCTVGKACGGVTVPADAVISANRAPCRPVMPASMARRCLSGRCALAAVMDDLPGCRCESRGVRCAVSSTRWRCQ